MQTVVRTPEFIKRAPGAGMSDADVVELVGFLATNPTAGDVIAGTGGARKLRWRVMGKGKSGGVRVITFYSGEDIPVFLLTVYGKGQKATLTAQEKNIVRVALSALPAAYKAKR